MLGKAQRASAVNIDLYGFSERPQAPHMYLKRAKQNNMRNATSMFEKVIAMFSHRAQYNPIQGYRIIQGGPPL